MKYTDSQRTEFKDTYTKRFRTRLIMLVLLFAVIASLALTKDGVSFFGLPAGFFGPIALTLAMIGWMIFSSRNWRCPACGESLGRAFNPAHCNRCGVELRG